MKIWSPSEDDFVSAPWYECPGTLNGVVPVNALPDWGSSVDAISEEFATKNRLSIEYTPVKTIGLLGNNRTESIGRTFVNFQFRGEQQSYWREFHILRRSVCDVILGKSFLAETQTLSKFAHRIVERIRMGIRKCDRLFLLDESPGDRIRCTVNGVPAAALPDTGSDLMLVSGTFVKRHGFKIRREHKYRRWVELIDGSTILTDGTVCEAKLEFDVPCEDLWSLDHGEYVDFAAGLSLRMGRTSDAKVTTFICDLHVIRDLPCDIILSGEFIFKTNVFSKFQGLFMGSAEAEGGGAGMAAQDSLLFVRKRLRWRLEWPKSRKKHGASETSSKHSYLPILGVCTKLT